MKKFSWYTIIHPNWNEGEPPLFRLVGPAILPKERTCDIYFKPNRKGGHTHNHIFNVVNKNYFSKIYGRKIKKNHKTKYMATFMYFLYDIDSVVSSFSRAHIFGKGKKYNIKESYLTIFR